jgi:hypothetical protein
MYVSKTATNLNDGIKNMMEAAKADYVKWSTSGSSKELSGYSLEQTQKWDSNTKVTEGKKYIKVVQENGVFCFVMKEDEGRFKKGDILKPAGWAKPALNSARGNVLTGNYNIQWTGPLYLK